MAVQDLLSQDEIDALLHGVDDGLVQTEPLPNPAASKATT
jgi:flagellar motor switch protein FliM